MNRVLCEIRMSYCRRVWTLLLDLMKGTQMTDVYTTELVALGTNLAQMAVKGTATAVSAKIRAIKR